MKIFSRYINNFNWNYIRKISSQVEKNWLQLFQDEHIEAAHVSIKELKLFVQKSFKVPPFEGLLLYFNFKF